MAACGTSCAKTRSPYGRSPNGGSQVGFDTCSAGELAGQHHAEAVATVFQTPTARRCESLTVTLAEIVRMRIGRIGEVVDPHGRSRVLVRQRHRRRVVATGTRTATAHVTKVPIFGETSVDFRRAQRLSMTTWRTSLPRLRRHRLRVVRSFRATSFAGAPTANGKECPAGQSGRSLHSQRCCSSDRDSCHRLSARA